MIYSLSSNKKVVSQTLPKGAHLGNGVFETLRARRTRHGYKVIGFSRHLRRLKRSAEFFKLPFFNEKVLASTLSNALSGMQEEDVLLRFMLFQEDALFSIEPYSAPWSFDRPLRVIPVKAERVFPQHKSSSALVSVHARRQAIEQGYDEAFLIDRNGLLREGAWCNIFWLNKRGELLTPASGVLPGITRELCLELAPEVKELDIHIDDFLSSAKEVFVTQSTNGIIPVSSIGNHDFAQVGAEATQSIQRAYQALMHSEEFERVC